MTVRILVAGAALSLVSAAAMALPTQISAPGHASLTGGTTITFDADPNTSGTSIVLDSNVTVTVIGPGTMFRNDNLDGGYGMSGKHIEQQGTAATFRLDFATPVTAFAFRWGAADNAWNYELFAPGNVSLGTLSTAPGAPFGYAQYYGAANGTAFTSVVWSSSSNDYIGFDDLTYVTGGSSVPAPGLALAFAVAAVAMRRRA